MTHELKPCPFCGGKAELCEDDRGDFFISCVGCYDKELEFNHLNGIKYTTKSYVIDRWNTRAYQSRIDYLEAMIDQMQNGCDGFCALNECICEKDQRVIDLKEEVEDITLERDKAQAMVMSWQNVFESIEAHIKDRIEMNDDANPERYLRIIQSCASCVIEYSKAICNSRWEDNKQYQARISELENVIAEKNDGIRSLYEFEKSENIRDRDSIALKYLSIGG